MKSPKFMGVLNLTPNSFSDGFKLDIDESKKRFSNICSWADIIDIGCESTAPFNKAILDREELDRFKNFFYPLLPIIEGFSGAISIDTYKVSVFGEVYKEIRKFCPSAKIIFNDISGQVDDELLSFLTANPEVQYVLCHNLAPSRELANSHQGYTYEGDNIIEDLAEFFQTRLEKLKDFDVVLDPCFGFSKSREQNHYLLKEMKVLIQRFNQNSFVFGVSRKSFLQFPPKQDLSLDENLRTLTAMETALIFDLRGYWEQLIVRTHEKSTVNALKSLGDINA